MQRMVLPSIDGNFISAYTEKFRNSKMSQKGLINRRRTKSYRWLDYATDPPHKCWRSGARRLLVTFTKSYGVTSSMAHHQGGR
jgi:hypothetical protein